MACKSSKKTIPSNIDPEQLEAMTAACEPGRAALQARADAIVFEPQARKTLSDDELKKMKAEQDALINEMLAQQAAIKSCLEKEAQEPGGRVLNKNDKQVSRNFTAYKTGYCYFAYPEYFDQLWPEELLDMSEVFLHCWDKQVLGIEGQTMDMDRNSRPLTYELDLAPFLVAGMRKAKKMGWDGDVTGIALLYNPLCKYAGVGHIRWPMVVIIRQGANGLHVVLSEVPLPDLEADHKEITYREDIDCEFQYGSV